VIPETGLRLTSGGLHEYGGDFLCLRDLYAAVNLWRNLILCSSTGKSRHFFFKAKTLMNGSLERVTSVQVFRAKSKKESKVTFSRVLLIGNKNKLERRAGKSKSERRRAPLHIHTCLLLSM